MSTNELYLIVWKCLFFKGGSFNVYGTIKALQYSISVYTMGW